MVPKQWITKFTKVLKKYRYALIVLLVGLLLMALPNGSVGARKADKELEVASTSSVEALEHRLSLILSKVEGAGDVEVILTVAAGEEFVYQTNGDQTDSGTSVSSKVNTVTVTDSDRDQTGLIKQVKSEIYKGAIIVCRGADNPTVRFMLVEAVSRITGLGANCISVLKMK